MNKKKINIEKKISYKMNCFNKNENIDELYEGKRENGRKNKRRRNETLFADDTEYLIR